MADRNREQSEFNKKLAEAKKLITDINRLRVQMNQAPLELSDQEAVKGIQSLRNEFKLLRSDIADVDGTASSLFQQIVGIAQEFGAINKPANQLKSAFRGLVNEASKLKNDELGLIDLRQRDLQGIQEKLKTRYEEARVAADQFSHQRQAYNQSLSLENDIVKINEDILELKEEQSKITGHSKIDEMARKDISELIEEKEADIANIKAEQVKLGKDISKEASEAFQFIDDQDNAYKGLLSKVQSRLKEERDITKLVGVTGALVEGTGALMERLGMRSGIFHDAMRDAAEEMRTMAKDTAKNVKSFTQLDIAAKGFSVLVKGFGEALLDPAVLIGTIVKGFFDVDKAATKLQQTTGQNSTTLVGFNKRLASSVDMMETMAELTEQTGMNAQNIFSPDVLAGAAELKNTMGLAADEAGGLAMIAQTTSGNIDQVTESIVDTTSAFNGANRSAVSQGQILRDVATTSDGIKASFAGMPGALGKAAAAARRMGMDLQRVDDIASSLLDFESSIEAEMEAQLLTGKAINLTKARELALTNDLAGLGEELFKNSASLAEFGKMNRIQQEAQAKALGMTRDELGKIAYQRALEVGMTAEQAAAAAGVRKEDMERMAVQERLAKAADKLAQAFAPMLEILVPITEVISSILTPIAGAVNFAMKLASAFGKVGQSIMGATVLGGVFTLRRALIKAFDTKIPGNFFTRFRQGIKDSFKGLKDLKAKITDAFSSKGSDLTDKITKDAKGRFAKAPGSDKAKDILEKTEGADPSKLKEPTTPGKNIKEFLTNLAEGLKAMGSTKVLGGALNLIPASIGFIAFIPGMVGVKLAERINGPKLQAGLTGLANGLMAMNKTFVGSLALGAAALAFTAMIPGSIGMFLVGAAGPAAAAGIFALIPAITALGAAMMTGVGAVGLAALAAGALALGGALALAAPGIKAFGTVIKAAADGISQILGAITLQSVLSLAALGPALISAGAGLTTFSIASLMALPGLGVLGALAAMATPLSTVGTSLTAVAAGIAAVSAALSTLETEKLNEIKDLVITTAFAAPAVAASGAITSLIEGITGGGEAESNKELLAKMDILIAAVEKGGNVYVDGDKVGTALTLGTFRSS